MAKTGIRRTKIRLNMPFFVSKQHKLSRFVMAIRNSYATTEKKLQKMLSELNKKSKVSRVGYRGKMFYLSDLLLHVIGFG
ncbi:hypothetical protein AWF80_030355 [Escherichia coli]|nr:hypothetical protein AWF80_030355 [Escherichia coli]TRY34527.1 hypothetical protein FNJ78_30190 [Escherichia coli]